MMFVSLVAFSLAPLGSSDDVYSSKFEMGAYALTVLNIVVGEALISSWRWSRDKELEALVDRAMN